MQLSIVMPVYNAEPFLERCVDSITPELSDEVELIIVNDGSTDNSGGIAERYALKYPTIKVLHKKNSGQVETRNLGIKTATGDYVCFIDADDWVENGYYGEGLSCAIENNADVVIMDYKHDIASKSYLKDFKEMRGLYESNQIRSKLIPLLAGVHYGNIINTSLWNKLFKRKLLLNNLGFVHSDLRNGEDACLLIASICDARRLCIIESNSFYHYVEHGNQISSQYDEKSLYRTRRLYETLSFIGLTKNISTVYLNEFVFSQYWKVLSQICNQSNIGNQKKLILIKEILRDKYLQVVVRTSKNGDMPYEKLKKMLIRFNMGCLIMIMCKNK